MGACGAADGLPACSGARGVGCCAGGLLAPLRSGPRFGCSCGVARLLAPWSGAVLAAGSVGLTTLEPGACSLGWVAAGGVVLPCPLPGSLPVAWPAPGWRSDGLVAVSGLPDCPLLSPAARSFLPALSLAG